MRPCPSGVVGRFLAVVGCVVLTSCGGGGGGGSSQNAPVLNVAGYWKASTISALDYNTSLSGNLTQAGDKISGTMTVIGSPCALSGALTGNHQRFELDYVIDGGTAKHFPQWDSISRRKFDYRYVEVHLV